MNTTLSQVAGISTLFLLIFLTGYRLNRSGKPYHAILFNFHKLVGLGGLVFWASLIYRTYQSAHFGPTAQATGLVAALLSIATIVTGGLVSLTKPAPATVAFLHKLLPYLTVLSCGATLFLLQ